MTIVHKRAVMLSIAALALSSASLARRRADLPRQADQDHRRGRRWRPDGHDGPRHRPADADASRPAGDHRKSARRRHDDRRQGRRPGRARRPDRCCGARSRRSRSRRCSTGTSTTIRRRWCRSRLVAEFPSLLVVPPDLPVAHDGGVHRLRQSASRHAELWRIARHAAAADGCAVQQGRRSRHDLCSLSRRRAVDARPDRRPPAHAVRRADAAGAAGQGGQAPRAGGSGIGALAPICPMCQPCANSASPISPAIPGPASWRRRRRRDPSSTSSTPSSTTSCARPKPRRAWPSLTSCSGQVRLRNSPHSSPKRRRCGCRWCGSQAPLHSSGPCHAGPGSGRIAGSKYASGRRRRPKFSSCAKKLRFHLRSGHSSRESRS